ncbi:periostin-like isoform X1 [Syngnathus acus]|uniref:periostin-like isoform X1 n=1 Tax=Syngnathus acus TaxID=161584 RepID=UPI0018864719|nr:periostin-like isoform X1 [Syngnathus acus]
MTTPRMHRATAAAFLLVALCSLAGVDASAYDKIVSHSRIRARTEGPNVCALQQVLGTKKKYFSTCRNWYKGAICGKKAMVVYECCPGYMRLEGMKGCPAVAPIEHVYGTLGLVKATETQQYADISKLREELEGGGSYTMFAPSNDAWDLLDTSVRSALVNNVNKELYNALRFHMLSTRLLTKDMKDGMSVTSMHDRLGLRVNHYANGVVTVNCARIIHANQVATNGVVHVVDRVISSVTNTIKGVLDVEDELSSFSGVALASGMMDKLDQPGHYTLFAPTNAAFNRLGPGHLERFMSDKDVIAALVNYHLLKSVQCSEAIVAGSVYETEEGSSVEVGCDGDSLTVNGIKMVLKKDIVTTNGVIHLIDQVLMPNSAKDVMELMDKGQSTFGDMVSELGLAAALGPKREYTLLAPINSAFTNEVMATDQTALRYLLQNHVLKLKVTLNELYNGQLLETMAGKFLRVFIYRTAVCIENACMVRGSKQGSNGVLHLIRTIIRPSEKTTYDILKADGRFKIFLALIETADLSELLKQEGSFTVFAPTDDAFADLSQEDMALLKRDPTALRTILLYHISRGIFINGGLEGGVTNLLKTLQGRNLQVLSVNDSIHVNSVDVPDSDLMATNGVIHVVKNLLYPADLPVGREDLLFILRKLIKYIKIRYVSGFSYSEIPLTFVRRTITTTEYTQKVPEETEVIRVIEEQPSITKVVESQPSITTVTRVIETEPTHTRVVVDGKPSVTTVTRVIETEPTHTRVVVDGEPSVTTVTRVIETEPTHTRVVVDGEPSVTTVTRVIESDPVVTRVAVRGEPVITEVTGVVEKQPTVTKVTRVISEPGVTKLTRVIDGGQAASESETIAGETMFPAGFQPHIIEGPDFSRITTIHSDPNLIEQESDRITKLIQAGGKFGAARKAPAGMRRRRTRLVKRHRKATPQ